MLTLIFCCKKVNHDCLHVLITDIAPSVSEGVNIHPQILLSLNVYACSHHFEEQDFAWKGQAENRLHLLWVVDVFKVVQCHLLSIGHFLLFSLRCQLLSLLTLPLFVLAFIELCH